MNSQSMTSSCEMLGELKWYWSTFFSYFLRVSPDSRHSTIDYFSLELHGVISEKIVIFVVKFVSASNLTLKLLESLFLYRYVD
jgi:hypothetical protein